ncbi:MAG: DUF1513 domain-containing protein [Pseudomonadota bacterium]|nr:DUF1513 domain-containing protein [Pseudomonadota bacterium]
MIESLSLQRRQWLALSAGLAGAALYRPAWANSNPARTRLAAAWQAAQGYQIGVLARRGAAFDVQAALDVPTRAHGVWIERSGALLAVARRPGDWLLRWQPGSAKATWSWIEPERAFNGHVIASPDGAILYTTETNLETGQGLIGLRHAASLEKFAEWPTHGMDPHELLLDSDASLLVANGGIPARPETGRLKLDLGRMDPSLVRLDTGSGALRGQWRLIDKRLSLRHIAWGPVPAGSATGQRLLGIAMQAEHDDPAQKAAAPVLAVFDGQQLRTCPAAGDWADTGKSLQGYGGAIVWSGKSFAVSCPRAHGVGLWRADGQWSGFAPLQEACALTTRPEPGAGAQLWAGGRAATLARHSDGKLDSAALPELRLDNHWAALS